jgi:hypothetical protein
MDRARWVIAALAASALLACGDVAGDVIVPKVASAGGAPNDACTGEDAGCAGLGPSALHTCSTASDCERPTPFCEPKSATCVECGTDNDCSEQTPMCDAVRHRCVACLSDTDCSAPEHCIASVERCAASCGADQSCPSEAAICDSSLQICVACRTNANCTDPEKPDCLNGECTDCAKGTCQ